MKYILMILLPINCIGQKLFDNTVEMVCNNKDSGLYNYLIDSAIDSRYEIISPPYTYCYRSGPELVQQNFSDRDEFRVAKSKGGYIHAEERSRSGSILYFEAPLLDTDRRITLDVHRLFHTPSYTFCNNDADTQLVHIKFKIHKDTLTVYGDIKCGNCPCYFCELLYTPINGVGFIYLNDCLKRIHCRSIRFYEDHRQQDYFGYWYCP